MATSRHRVTHIKVHQTLIFLCEACVTLESRTTVLLLSMLFACHLAWDGFPADIRGVEQSGWFTAGINISESLQGAFLGLWLNAWDTNLYKGKVSFESEFCDFQPTVTGPICFESCVGVAKYGVHPRMASMWSQRRWKGLRVSNSRNQPLSLDLPSCYKNLSLLMCLYVWFETCALES